MKLNEFIRRELEPILAEWEAYARTLIPPSETMSREGLRDDAERMLLTIAKDLQSPQTEAQRERKSKGEDPPSPVPTAASVHGSLRHLAGFDLKQLASEYRALRASVLRLWKKTLDETGESAELEEVNRFNEAIDQSLAESVASYADGIAASRDTFLAILGHDLRNPLGALDGCVRILHNDRAPPETRRHAFDIASRSIGVAERLITDLLEYTRARLGDGIQVSLETTDLGQLCAEIAQEVRAAYPDRQLVLEVSDPLIVRCDAERMRQVLTNLLANALHYGAADSPVILAAEESAAGVTLEVKNFGKPIPEDAQQVIFNPLVQLADAEGERRDRPSTSMGLGLYIAREIVKAHGGTIAVQSSPSTGTSFIVQLPKP